MIPLGRRPSTGLFPMPAGWVRRTPCIERAPGKRRIRRSPRHGPDALDGRMPQPHGRMMRRPGSPRRRRPFRDLPFVLGRALCLPYFDNGEGSQGGRGLQPYESRLDAAGFAYQLGRPIGGGSVLKQGAKAYKVPGDRLNALGRGTARMLDGIGIDGKPVNPVE